MRIHFSVTLYIFYSPTLSFRDMLNVANDFPPSRSLSMFQRIKHFKFELMFYGNEIGMQIFRELKHM